MASETSAQSSWHLRHVGPPATVENSSSIIRLPVHGNVTVGRGPTADYFLDSKVHLRLISRVHASITGERLTNGHVRFQLTNLGLNGTYINDFKLGTDIEKTKVLHEGDKVVFGHVNSGSIQVGAYAPQPQSEFQFIFEKVNGLEEKQARLNPHPTSCTADVVQRIQSNTSGPKLEYGSLSPRSNGSVSEKENKFCDIPINLSSNSTFTKSLDTTTAFSDNTEKHLGQGQSLRQVIDNEAEEGNVSLEKDGSVSEHVNTQDGDFKNQNFVNSKQRTLDYSEDFCIENDCPTILSRVEDNSNESFSKDVKTEIVNKTCSISSENEKNRPCLLPPEVLKRETSADIEGQEKNPSKSSVNKSKVKGSRDDLVTNINKNNCNISEYSIAKPLQSSVPRTCNSAYVEICHNESKEKVDTVKHCKEEQEKDEHRCMKGNDKSDCSSVKTDKKVVKDSKHLSAPLVSVSETAPKDCFESRKQKHDPYSPSQICSEKDKGHSRSSFSYEHKHKHLKSRKVDKDRNSWDKDRINGDKDRINGDKDRISVDKDRICEQGSKPPPMLENLTVHHIDFGSGRYTSHSPNRINRYGKCEPSEIDAKEDHSPSDLKDITFKRHVLQSPASSPDSQASTSKGFPQDPSHKHSSPRKASPSNSSFSSLSSDEPANVNSVVPGSLSKMTTSSSPHTYSSLSSSEKSRSACMARSFVRPKDGLFDSSDEGSGEEGGSPVNNTPCIIKKIYSPFKKLHSKTEKENKCKNNLTSLSENGISEVKSQPDVKISASSLAADGKKDTKGKLVSKNASSNEDGKKNKLIKDLKSAFDRFVNGDSVAVSPQSLSSVICTSPPVLLSPPREPAKDTNLPSSPPPLISPAKLSFLKSHLPQELKNQPEPIRPPDISLSLKSQHDSTRPPDTSLSPKSQRETMRPPDTSLSPKSQHDSTRPPDTSLSPKSQCETMRPPDISLSPKSQRETTRSPDISLSPKSQRETTGSPDFSCASTKGHEKQEPLFKSSMKQSKLKLKAAKHPESTPLSSIKKSSPLKLHTEAETSKKKVNDVTAMLKSPAVSLSPLQFMGGFPENGIKSSFNKYKIPRRMAEADADSDQVDGKSPSKSSAKDSSSEITSSPTSTTRKENTPSKKISPSVKKDQAEGFLKARPNGEVRTKVSNSKQTILNFPKVSSSTNAPLRPRLCKSDGKKSDAKTKDDENEVQEPPAKTLRTSVQKRKIDFLSSEDDDEQDFIPLRESPKSRSCSDSPHVEAPSHQTASCRSISKSTLRNLSSVSKNEKSLKPRQAKRVLASNKGKKRRFNKRRAASRRTSDSSDEESPGMEDDIDFEDIEDAWNLPDGVQYFDNPCNAVECKNPAGIAVNWVMCDKCEQWYHLICVDASLEDVQNENTQFVCGFC